MPLSPFARHRTTARQISRAAPAGIENPDSGIVQAELVVADTIPDVGKPCPACSCPREGSSKFCVACGAPLETPDSPVTLSGRSGSDATALPHHTFRCQGCGSEVATSLEQRSYVCPFCSSAYVVELPVVRSGRQRPEFVIGFAVSAEQAKEKFFEWLGKNSWFRPSDLANRAIAEKQKGVYLPFWHFSMLAESVWSATIGEYWYRTETYTTRDSNGKMVTRTRQVRETEWWPLHGKHHKYYFGYMIPATKGITAKEASAIQPYQLSALARYRPYFLAGWMAEEYSIPIDDGIQRCQEEFRQRQIREIERFLPGDTFRSLNVTTELAVNGSDLILLPVHVLSYRYRNKQYRFLVNGQTGRAIGEKPWSTKKIVFAIGLGLCVILALILAVVILSRQ